MSWDYEIARIANACHWINKALVEDAGHRPPEQPPTDRVVMILTAQAVANAALVVAQSARAMVPEQDLAP